MENPKAGEQFECDKCGMKVQITTDCKCQTGSPKLECCGQPLTKA